MVDISLEAVAGKLNRVGYEALFKAFAKAVDLACQHDPRIAGRVPSTKGKL